MLFIGITGGVGAGKSEILSHLRKNYKGEVLLADQVAHDLMEPGTECYQKIRECFREEQIFGPEGSIDRAAMAKIIFSSEEKREALNAIVHPQVKAFVLQTVQKAREEKILDFVVLEAALLIEEQYDKICDELWYIYTSEENRTKRLMASRGYTEEKIRNIFASQLSEQAYRQSCLAVIDNNKTPKEAYSQIDRLLQAKGIYPVGKFVTGAEE